MKRRQENHSRRNKEANLEQPPIDIGQEEEQEVLSLEDRFQRWISAYGKRSLLLTLGALLVLVTVTQLTSSGRKEALTDHLPAKRIQQQLQQPSVSNRESLANQLSDLITKHPELATQYGTVLSHAILSDVWTNSETSKKERLAQATANFHPVKEVHSTLTPFIQFSNTSLLITENQKKVALKNTQLLQQELEALWGSHKLPILEMFNLLRLTTLTKELGDSTAAKDAWKKLLSKEKEYPSAFAEFAKHLQEGSVTLDEYPI